MKAQRESNFELLRIVAMLMIITGHTISWGGIEKISSSRISVIINIIYAFIVVEVNLYLLITGYFQSRTKFKFDKFVKLLLVTYFYKVSITYICYKLGYIQLTSSSLLWNLSPFDFSNYWFIKIYLSLYCLSPFLNSFINLISRKKFKILLSVLFILCSIMTTITNQEIFTNSGGFSLVQFVFMYLVGAYISKYIITEEKKQALYSNRKRLNKTIYISLLLYFFPIAVNYVLYRIGIYIVKFGGWFQIIGSRMETNYMHYDNPLVIVAAIGLFSFFALITIKSKVVNFLSSSVFSIYLIHETVLFRPILYSFFGLNKYNFITSRKIFIHIAFVVFTIFTVCTLIEHLRKMIFVLINKLFSNLKIYKNFNDKYKLLCLKLDELLNC